MEKENYCLCLEDLFYLLITTLRMNGIHPNRFSYRELREYGQEIIGFGKEKGVGFYLRLSKDETTYFLNSHSDIVKEDTVYIGFHGIKLTKRLSNDEIREEFCSYFPLTPLLVIYDENFTKKIVDKYKKEHGLNKSEKEQIYRNRVADLNYGDLFCCMALNLWNNIGVDKLSFYELDKYAKLLLKFANQEKIDITLNLTPMDTQRFLLENSYEVFGITNNSKDNSGLFFKRNVLKSEIEREFLKYLPYYVKDLITDPRFEKKIISMYKKDHGIDNRQRLRSTNGK